MSTHDNYHGAKFDKGKPRYDLIRPGFEKAVAEVLTFGAEKYAAHSWMYVPDMEERYYAALRRHLDSHRSGEKNDPETGLLHLAHAACNIYFLLQWEIEKDEYTKAETQGVSPVPSNGQGEAGGPVNTVGDSAFVSGILSGFSRAEACGTIENS